MTCTDSLPKTCDSPTGPALPVDQVFAWLLEGQRDSDIRAAIKAYWPEVDPQELQLAAAERFAVASQFDIDVVNGWALEAYRDLYRRMVRIGDFAGAMRAVKELVSLANRVQRDPTQEGEDLEQPDEPDQVEAPPIDRPQRAPKRRRPQKRPAESSA